MKDYRLFDISDFVMDEDFIRWVNQRNKTDDDFWNNWLSQHPDKHIVVAEARRIVESIGTEERVIGEEERENEIRRLLSTIREQPYVSPIMEFQSHRNAAIVSKKWWYAAAAVFVGAIGFAIYFLQRQNTKPGQFAYSVITPSKHLIESVNTSEKTISLKLPDESVVELGAGSRIAYANNFDSSQTRDVYLLGEALFTVMKNPAHPFRVFANEIVTKVLGTSFTVRSFNHDSTIQVTVRTGKVSVYSQENTNNAETASPNQLGGIILTPNQELVYKKSNREFKKTLLQNPVVIAPDAVDQKIMLYDDAALDKVFGQLSKIYGVNIVYDSDLLKKCTITADLRTETFYRKLDLICKAIGAEYEIIDGQVVIQSNGCE